MPELPEVQTTVNGLRQCIVGLTIVSAWSNYNSPYWSGSENIKDPKYFKHFKKEILGHKVISIGRRAKNILINLNNDKTILVHLKMTGHLLYGRYQFLVKNKKDPWQPIDPEPLKDPYNRHIRFVLSFDNGYCLALSDVRRFAKVAVVNSTIIHYSKHLHGIGPEPLDPKFTLKEFVARLEIKPHGKIKQVLIDQAVIAGIGNIYADESLWRAGIHPLEHVENISVGKRRLLYEAIQKTLSRGIDLGGDSTSDYRNVNGEKGRFHEQHYAYQMTDTRCQRPSCHGTITRIVVGGRGTHFCNVHQVLRENSK